MAVRRASVAVLTCLAALRYNSSTQKFDFGVEPMSSMKFRRSCSGCNATFFATDRRALHCPKCARKKQDSKPQSPQEAASARPRIHQGHTASIEHHIKKGEAKQPRPQMKKRQPRPPKASQLTDELRAKIETVYQTYKDSTDSLKKLHAKISNEVWIKPMLVAEVVKRLHHKPVKSETCSLSEELRNQVLTRYLAMVRDNERPPEGRRAAIAKEFNLPNREVILAVREWSFSVMGQLNRIQLFAVEKEYWGFIENGGCRFADLPKLISERVEFASEEQVSRWLDQLHDDSKIGKNLPPISEEQIAQIVDAYRNYLQETAPPEESLHWTLAKRYGVLPTQVHKTLCDYRRSRKPQ